MAVIAPSDEEKFCAQLEEVYDNYRTSLMNAKYYASRLTSFRIYNRIYEIILALGMSSAIAGWSFFQEWTFGKKAWAIFSGLVTVLAVLKPILQLPSQIERYSKLHIGYTNLYYDSVNLVSRINESKKEISESKSIPPEILQTREATQKRFKDLALQDDIKISKPLLRKCYDEVNAEIPVKYLWYPELCKKRPTRSKRRKEE